jgi:hypothetical protein
MIYTKEQAGAMKEAVKTAVKQWAEEKIDTLFGRGHVVAHYMKRGLTNYLARMDSQADKAVDMLTLFAGDEAGNVDTDKVVEDMMQLFREMEVRKTQLGMLNVRYGEGRIVVDVPHSALYDMVFGKYGTITITADDILELKEMIK